MTLEPFEHALKLKALRLQILYAHLSTGIRFYILHHDAFARFRGPADCCRLKGKSGLICSHSSTVNLELEGNIRK